MVKLHKMMHNYVCIKLAYSMHKYSSKTVKNESRCQNLAKSSINLVQNEGNNKKIFKKAKKYSKRG